MLIITISPSYKSVRWFPPKIGPYQLPILVGLCYLPNDRVKSKSTYLRKHSSDLTIATPFPKQEKQA